jgi:uncharacterized damage-inducible protein DinB
VGKTRRASASPAPSASAAGLARAFLEESRRRLRGEYLPKIARVVALLDVADLWWRPNRNSNSIGNLLLHLDGNLRQWIVHGVGGRADVRDRDAEFAARRSVTGRALVQRLRRTVLEADEVLAGLSPRDLRARRRIQGYDVTVLQAVYHVVEHFSGHTGQILYAAKLRSGRDLDLYPHLRTARHRAANDRRGATRGRSAAPKRPRRFM